MKQQIIEADKQGIRPAIHEHQTTEFNVHFDFDDVDCTEGERDIEGNKEATIDAYGMYKKWDLALKEFIQRFYTKCCTPYTNKRVYVLTNHCVGKHQTECGIHIVFQEPTISELMVPLGDYMNKFFAKKMKPVFGQDSVLDLGIYGGIKSLRMPFCRKFNGQESFTYKPFNTYLYKVGGTVERIIPDQDKREIAKIEEMHPKDSIMLPDEMETKEQKLKIFIKIQDINDDLRREYLDKGTIRRESEVKPNKFRIFPIAEGLAGYINQLEDKTSIRRLCVKTDTKFTTKLFATQKCPISLVPGSPTFTDTVKIIEGTYTIYKEGIDLSDPSTIDNKESEKYLKECSDLLCTVAFICNSDKTEYTLDYNKLGQLSLFGGSKTIACLIEGLVFYFTDKKRKKQPKKKTNKRQRREVSDEDIYDSQETQPTQLDCRAASLLDGEDEAEDEYKIREIKLYDHWKKVGVRYGASNVVFNPRVLDPVYYFESDNITGQMVNLFPGYSNELDYFIDKYNRRTEEDSLIIKKMNMWIMMGLCGGKLIAESTSKSFLEERLTAFYKDKKQFLELEQDYKNIMAKRQKDNVDMDLSEEAKIEDDIIALYKQDKVLYDRETAYWTEDLVKQAAKEKKERQQNIKAEINTYHNFFRQLLYFMINYPWMKSGIFLVMFGPQGNGKTLFWKWFAKTVYGPDSPLYVVFNNSDQLFGHFSSEALNRCLLAHLDEASIAPEHMAQLKSNVTDKVLIHNNKWKEMTPALNYLQIVMTLNPSTFKTKVVHLEATDRRTFVLETAKIFPTVGDMDEFVDLLTQDIWDMWVGELLSDEEIKKVVTGPNWNPQAHRPITRFFTNQKMDSFNDIQKWWLECLRREYHIRDWTDADITKNNSRRQPTVDDNNHLWYMDVEISLIYECFRAAFPGSTSYNNVNNFQKMFGSCIGLDPNSLAKMLMAKKNFVAIPTHKECINIFVKEFNIPPFMLGLPEEEDQTQLPTRRPFISKQNSLLNLDTYFNNLKY